MLLGLTLALLALLLCYRVWMGDLRKCPKCSSRLTLRLSHHTPSFNHEPMYVAEYRRCYRCKHDHLLKGGFVPIH